MKILLPALRTALLALLFLAPPSWAQDVARICGKPVTPSAPFERQALIDQTAADMAAGQTQAALDKLAASYEQTLRPAERGTPESTAFLQQLRAPTSRWSALWEISNDDDGNAVLFERDATARKVVIRCDTPPAANFHDMAAIASYVHVALAAQEAEPKMQQFAALKKQAMDHENLIRNGFPMWPWELWLNGRRLGKSDAAPLFKTQYIFFRPTAGVEINTRSREDADLEASLAIEPIGFIHYTDDTYSKWWGLSAVITASTGDGMGYGGLLRYGRYSAGLTLHKSDVEGDDVHLLLGVDFYDLIESKRAEFPQYKDDLKKAFSDLLK